MPEFLTMNAINHRKILFISKRLSTQTSVGKKSKDNRLHHVFKNALWLLKYCPLQLDSLVSGRWIMGKTCQVKPRFTVRTDRIFFTLLSWTATGTSERRLRIISVLFRKCLFDLTWLTKMGINLVMKIKEA